MVTNDTILRSLMKTHKKIIYYRQMVLLAENYFQRIYYENLLYNHLFQLDNILFNLYFLLTIHPDSKEEISLREFTLEELAEFNGAGNKPAYVAVNGIVYNVTLNSTWGGGTHFGLYAGQDLTAQFANCHKGSSILNLLPVVGRLKT